MRCIHRLKKGTQCPFTGVGDPPFCKKHERYRPRKLNPYVEQVIDVIMVQDPIKKMVNRFTRILDNVGGIVDKVAGGDYSELEDLLRKGFKPRVNFTPAPPGKDPLLARVILGFTAVEVLTEKKIKDRRRELARKYHSDVGGNDSMMQKINAAADELLETIGG